MNGLHEQNHKRTSINELLNPVANGPASGSLDPSYNPAQLGPIPSPPYASSPHGQRVPPVPPYSLDPARTSFNLRAASWDQSSESEMGRRQDGESSSSCRYGSASSQPHHAHPHQPPPHPVYADQYLRPRPVGEPANYGIDVSPWTPNSHEHSPYGAQMLTPMYSDERTGVQSSALLVAIHSAHRRRRVPQSSQATPRKRVSRSHTASRDRALTPPSPQTTLTRNMNRPKCSRKPMPMVTFPSCLDIQPVWF